MMKATVSGSFHRHMSAIYASVNELRAARVDVLSPSDPRIVDHLREFLFVASDRTRLKRQVQQRHFEAISNSDFLWLVCPDGYVGVSAAMEIGWAIRSSVPVYSIRRPNDVTLEDFVGVVPSINEAVTIAGSSACGQHATGSMLLDPDAAARAVVGAAEQSAAILTGRTTISADGATHQLRKHAKTVRDAVSALSR